MSLFLLFFPHHPSVVYDTNEPHCSGFQGVPGRVFFFVYRASSFSSSYESRHDPTDRSAQGQGENVFLHGHLQNSFFHGGQSNVGSWLTDWLTAKKRMTLKLEVRWMVHFFAITEFCRSEFLAINPTWNNVSDNVHFSVCICMKCDIFTDWNLFIYLFILCLYAGRCGYPNAGPVIWVCQLTFLWSVCDGPDWLPWGPCTPCFVWSG